jgi:GntR family transcriptional regulator
MFRSPRGSQPATAPGRLFADSPLPRYAQLAELLRQRIVRGLWPKGHKLPSIEELMQEFGIARVTVRQAVDLLARDGVLSPQPGRGTFVTALPAQDRSLKLETSLRTLADVYRHDKPKLTLIEEAAANAPLQPEDGAPAPQYRFMRRVHSNRNEAYCVISLYLDDRVFRRAPSRFRRETAIPVLLELPGLRIANARQTVTISTADVEVATHLSVALGSPVALVRRVFTDASGTVLYLAEVTYRGDYIRFEMDLRA